MASVRHTARSRSARHTGVVPTGSPRPETSSVEQAYAEKRLQQLRAARAEAEKALVVDPRLAVRDWRRILLPVAEELLRVFDKLSADTKFWQVIDEAERNFDQVDEADRLAVDEILDSDLGGLLDLMGHRPPPDTANLALDLRVAIAEVSPPRRNPGSATTTSAGQDRVRGSGTTTEEQEEEGEPRLSERTRAARTQLSLYTYHLRRLVDAARAAADDQEGGQDLGTRLLGAVRKGVAVLAPVTLAAAAVALLAGPGWAAGAVAVSGAALSEGGREFLKKVFEVGCTVLVSWALGGQEVSAEPEHVFLAAQQRFRDALSDLDDLAGWLAKNHPEPRYDRALVRGYTIDTMRCFFDVERARLSLPQRRGAVGSVIAVGAAGAAILAFRDWYEGGASPELAEDYAAALTHASREVDRTLLALTSEGLGRGPRSLSDLSL